jgi:hypothetical protein
MKLEITKYTECEEINTDYDTRKSDIIKLSRDIILDGSINESAVVNRQIRNGIAITSTPIYMHRQNNVSQNEKIEKSTKKYIYKRNISKTHIVTLRNDHKFHRRKV